jgi:hypothetical protein
MKWDGIHRDVSDISSGNDGASLNALGVRLAVSGEIRRRLTNQRTNIAKAASPIRNIIGFNTAPSLTAANTFLASGGIGGDAQLGMAQPITPGFFTFLAGGVYMRYHHATTVYGHVATDVSNNVSIYIFDNAGVFNNIGVDIVVNVNSMSISANGTDIILQDGTNTQFHHINGTPPTSLIQTDVYTQYDFVFGNDNSVALCHGVNDSRYGLRLLSDGTVTTATTSTFVNSPDHVAYSAGGMFAYALAYTPGGIVRVNFDCSEDNLGFPPSGSYGNIACVLRNGNVIAAMDDDTVYKYELGTWTLMSGINSFSWARIMPCEDVGYFAVDTNAGIEIRDISTMALMQTVLKPTGTHTVNACSNGRLYANNNDADLFTMDPV